VVKLANCPKCGHKLRVIDWKPECPNCGVNMVYYNFEEQFYIDAKGAEMDAAKIRVKWARAKTAFIGGKLLIARLSLCFLPLIAALLSFGSLKIVFPLFEKKLPFSIIGLFSFFTDGTLNYLSAIKGSEIVGIYAKHAVNIFFGLAAVAGFALLVFFLELLCFISIKKMTVILAVTSALGIVATLWSIIAVNNFARVTASAIFTVANGYGGFAVIFAFTVIFMLNFVIAKKGVKIKYVEGDLYRIEMAKKLKRREITLDEIPQPVYSPDAQAPAAGDEPAAEGGSPIE
jgi:hypothetical protein